MEYKKMKYFKTTKAHEKFWEKRQIDWEKDYLSTWNHPHRKEILDILKYERFGSILELGCASGPNLVLIEKVFPQVQVGGIDISADAIATARKFLKQNAVLEVGPIDNMFFSNKSGDIILTDASLIYIGHDKIDKVMNEMKRIGRRKIVLVEFHSTSFLKRLALKLASGYNAYDYKKLLQKHKFYDIEIKKLPDYWNGEPWKTFGHLITAKI